MTGVALYLLPYFALQIGIIPVMATPYTALNIAATGFVSIGPTTHFNLASRLIQVSFMAIDLVGIALRLLHTHFIAWPQKTKHCSAKNSQRLTVSARAS